MMTTRTRVDELELEMAGFREQLHTASMRAIAESHSEISHVEFRVSQLEEKIENSCLIPNSAQADDVWRIEFAKTIKSIAQNRSASDGRSTIEEIKSAATMAMFLLGAETND